MRLILASSSPRRRDLLALLQVPFDVVPPEGSAEVIEAELSPGFGPEDRARLLAERKAQSLVARFPDRLILASDTLIAIGPDVLGKPTDVGEAEAMLRRLRGREHVIHTGVALVREQDRIRDSAVESVRVWMKSVTDAEVHDYVLSGEGMGKAGGYAIQGRGGGLIARIAGDFPAAVGLPLRLVAEMLRRRAVETPVDLERLYQTAPYPNWSRFAPPAQAMG